MKKKVSFILMLVLTLILSLYVFYAGVIVNTVGIYLVSYELGKIFAATYRIVGIIALLCWIVLIRMSLKKLKEWGILETKQKENIVENHLEMTSEIQKNITLEKEEDTEEDIEEEIIVEKKCVECGTVLEKNAKFCIHCGRKVD